MVQKFVESIRGQLEFSLREKEWWLDAVAQGLCTFEQAKGYIENEDRIISAKKEILSFI